VFVAESSESFRAADREQFYVSASRFKEALTIYTDDKHQLLEAVRKSSHRPSALDLVKKEISESISETEINKPATATVAENEQKETPQIQRPVWLPKPQIRRSQSRGVSM
jgi:hypothetical protein